MSPIDQNSLAIETIQSPLHSAIQYLRRKEDQCLVPTLPAERNAELTGDAKLVSEFLKNNFLINIPTDSVATILKSASQENSSLAVATNQFLLSNKDLLKDACKRTIGNLDARLDIDSILNPVFEHVCSILREDLPKAQNLKIIVRSNHLFKISVDEAAKEREVIAKKRTKANKAIENDPLLAELLDRWESNPLALEDDEFKNFLTAKTTSAEFISTDFDTAQHGHESPLLIKAVEQNVTSEMKRLEEIYWDKEKYGKGMAYKMFLSQLKEVILDALAPNRIVAARSFSENNLFFASNGSNAFRLFAHSHLRGKRLLATCDEYEDMLNGVEHEKMVNFPDDEQFLLNLKERFCDKNSKPDYFLVSYPSRRGPLFPMREIQGLCEQYGVHLIIDGCQAIGRRVIDLGSLKPSVFIGSSHKGSLFAGPVGLLAVSDALIANDRGKLDIYNSDFGTQNLLHMQCFAYACAPEMLGKDIVVDKIQLPASLTASVKLRQEAIERLSEQFIEAVGLLQEQSRKNTLQILHPEVQSRKNAPQILRPVGTADSKIPLSGIFECVFPGVDREIIAALAAGLGINIAKEYYQPLEPESFRIAMHPFMDKQSILMLAHLFQQIQGLSAESIKETREEIRESFKKVSRG